MIGTKYFLLILAIGILFLSYCVLLGQGPRNPDTYEKVKLPKDSKLQKIIPFKKSLRGSLLTYPKVIGFLVGVIVSAIILILYLLDFILLGALTPLFTHDAIYMFMGVFLVLYEIYGGIMNL